MQKVPLFGSSAPSGKEEEQKKAAASVTDLLDEELSEEALAEINSIVDAYIESFETMQHKGNAIKYTVMPLKMVINNPADQKWRSVNTAGSFLKQISALNSGALERFFEAIGFTKISENNFKF